MSAPESREKAVFYAALDLTEPAQRREFLDEACAGDAELRAAVDELQDRAGSSVVYGGSAGPGLLTRLGGNVDGLFLGRFAHDPAALGAVLVEAAGLARSRT